MKNVYWILELSIKEGKLQGFRSLMNEMSAATEDDEPGAMNYEWWLNDDKTVCHIHERYADADATMEHMGNFGAKFADRFMAHVEPVKFTIYGGIDNRVREALAPFGPVFMKEFGGFTR